MKKFVVIAAMLLLAAACSKSPRAQPPSTVSDKTSGWNSYKSPDKYGFSIKYPSDFGFNTNIYQVQSQSYIPICDEYMVACAFLAQSKYPGTNFDGAGVSVSIYPDLNTQAKCYDFKVATNAAQTQVPDATINGLDFKSATGGDAGAGHFVQLKVYRNFHNNQCYEVSEHVGSTNIDNYPQGTVKQFNADEVWQKLQDVVNTFEFNSTAQ